MSRNITVPLEAAANCDPKAASQSAEVAIFFPGELGEVADEAKSEDQLNLSWFFQKSSLDFIVFTSFAYVHSSCVEFSAY